MIFVIYNQVGLVSCQILILVNIAVIHWLLQTVHMYAHADCLKLFTYVTGWQANDLIVINTVHVHTYIVLV